MNAENEFNKKYKAIAINSSLKFTKADKTDKSLKMLYNLILGGLNEFFPTINKRTGMQSTISIARLFVKLSTDISKKERTEMYNDFVSVTQSRVLEDAYNATASKNTKKICTKVPKAPRSFFSLKSIVEDAKKYFADDSYCEEVTSTVKKLFPYFIEVATSCKNVSFDISKISSREGVFEPKIWLKVTHSGGEFKMLLDDVEFGFIANKIAMIAEHYKCYFTCRENYPKVLFEPIEETIIDPTKAENAVFIEPSKVTVSIRLKKAKLKRLPILRQKTTKQSKRKQLYIKVRKFKTIATIQRSFESANIMRWLNVLLWAKLHPLIASNWRQMFEYRTAKKRILEFIITHTPNGFFCPQLLNLKNNILNYGCTTFRFRAYWSSG